MDFWVCRCGTENGVSRPTCGICGRPRDIEIDIDLERERRADEVRDRDFEEAERDYFRHMGEEDV